MERVPEVTTGSVTLAFLTSVPTVAARWQPWPSARVSPVMDRASAISPGRTTVNLESR